MTEETSNIIDIREKLKQLESRFDGSRRLKGGGSDGTFDDMEPRVKALEDGQKSILEKLEKLMVQSGELKGQLTGMPSAATFGTISEKLGELKGRIDRLPSTAKIGTLFAIAVAIVTIATRWSDIKTLFAS